MKISKALKTFIEESKQGDSYWVESAKLQFALSLERQRRAVDMTYRALAHKLGTSAAYVSKVFRGDSNVTIASMVKLARATGGRLELNVVDAASKVTDWHLAIDAGKGRSHQTTLASNPVVVVNDHAVNDRKFDVAA